MMKEVQDYAIYNKSDKFRKAITDEIGQIY